MNQPVPLRAVAEVLSNTREGASSHRLTLAVSDWPGAAAGQFAMLTPGGAGRAERFDPLLPRPMAVYRTRAHASGDGVAVEFLYKVVGRGTALLAACREGDPVRLVGPLGESFPIPEPGTRCLLVGGGTGIASLLELAARDAARCDVRVLLGARTAGDLMGEADFEALPVSLRIATDDGSRGERGRVTELLARELAEAAGAGVAVSVSACGPTPMMERAAELAARHEAPCWVSLENTMACGFGVCLGCAVPRAGGGFALVCRDGPVVEARAVDWGRLA